MIHNIGAILLLLFYFNFGVSGQVEYAGVNLAGAEFGGNNLPGNYNQHYTYPTRSEVDYFTGKGMNIFRLPFKWERLQHSANEKFNTAELGRLDQFIVYTTSKKAFVILDPHNYARYYGKIIGSDELPVSAFEDFWQKLASHYKDNPFVIFGLMNEPYGMETELWLSDANAAIGAIRSTGAKNLILVPGNAYTGAHSWTSTWYGTPNGTAMLDIVDPGDNYAFEVHQYLDDNSSGTSATCVGPTIGSTRLKNFTNWLRTNDKRGFLGEFGCSTDEKCLAALDDMLEYIDKNADVWLGWAYWAAGPWWGEYMFTIEPKNGTDRPQLAVLIKHIGADSGANSFHPEKVEGFVLCQNYPNPFNASTQIEFDLPVSADVELLVYNTLGGHVTCLEDNYLSSGRHYITWNGRNTSGENVTSGIYLLSLRYGENNSIFQKMVLVR
ncbi:cellulase family glycosylhydrolase [candidate division KSB1 bacterium]|nr:cellulase family glycosylhydrolase [candidate division KSB1 bacterium]